MKTHTPTKSAYSSHYQDFDGDNARLFKENLAQKLLKLKGEVRSDSPSLIRESVYKSQFEKKQANLPEARQPDKRNNFSLFCRSQPGTEKSVYQVCFGPKGRVLDDTVRPQRAPELLPKNSGHFRGQSTYDSEYTVLPKISKEEVRPGQDHLTGSAELGRQVFRSMLKDENQVPDKAELRYFRFNKAPNDNAHFFPQRESYHGMFVSSYQKNFEKGSQPR